MRSILTTLAIATMALAAHSRADAAPTSAPEAYPLSVCIVSDEPLGAHGDTVTKTYDGREVRFCCAMCVDDFEKDRAASMKALDAAVIEMQRADYPLETCVVSGEALGTMGAPYDYVMGGRLVRFCCAGCIGSFDADPAAAMATVHGDTPAAEATGDDHAGHGH